MRNAAQSGRGINVNKAIKWYTNNLTLWVILFGVAAYVWPAPFLVVKPLINLFFALTMFGIGMVITGQNYADIVRSPLKILFGNLCQFTIMPLVAFGVARLFALPPAITLGLVLTGAAPGAMTSNVLSYLSEGDVAYSVSLTAVATLLSPLLTPALVLLLAGSRIPVPYVNMFFTILYTVVIPLLLGFLARRVLGERLERIKDIPPAISVTAIWIITSYVLAANHKNLGAATLLVFLAVILINAAGMAGGFFAGRLARLPFKQKKTLAIEIGMQNAGLGVVLALEHFPQQPAVAVPAALFATWCIISASLMVSVWRRLGQRAEA